MPKRTSQTPNENKGRSNLYGKQSQIANKIARPGSSNYTNAQNTTKGTTSSPTR